MLSQLKRGLTKGVAVFATILVLGPYARASAQPDSACRATEILRRIERSSSLDDLVAAKGGQGLPHGEAAIAIVAAWLGRPESADARRPVGDEKMKVSKEVFMACANAGSAGANLLIGMNDSGAAASASLLKQARTRFELAALQGVSIANLGIASIAYRMNEVSVAERALDALQVRNNNFNAELFGVMLRAGIVLPKSGMNASYWLAIAATRDNSAVAQRALFEMYSRGEGVAQSDSEAHRWRGLLDQNPNANRDWQAESEILDGMSRPSH